MKAYPTYKNSGVPWLGDIPTHWKITRLRSILHKITQKGQPDLPLLSVVREQGVILRDVESKEENHNYIPNDLSNYKVLREGQFVINKMKAWQGSYSVSSLTGIVSPAYFIYDVDYSDLTPQFFNTAIRSRAYIGFFNQASDGVRVGQWDLDEAQMRNIPLFVPTLEEQNAIVAYLDKKCAEIEELIIRRQSIIEKLRELKQSIIAEAVTKGLHPDVPMKESGSEWIGDTPEKWQIVRFSRLVKCKIAGAWGDEAKDAEGDILCIRIADFDFDHFIFDDSGDLTRRNYNNEKITKLSLKQGDILVEKSGGGAKTPVGRAIIFDKEYPALYSNFIEKLILSDGVIAKWFLFVWNAFYFTGRIRHFIKQTTGIQNLDINTMLRSTVVSMPPYHEQKVIVAYLDKKCAEIDELISRHEQTIKKLKELKTSTIAHVVTGKVNVRESI